MKKILYSCVAILFVAGIMIYGFISAPKVIHVNRQIEVTAYKLEDHSFSKKVSILLSGVFDEKSKNYLGEITVNGKKYTNCTLDPKFARMMCTAAGYEGTQRELLGRVYADKAFKEWSFRVGPSNDTGESENNLYSVLDQGSTNTDDIILSTSATDRESSLKMYDRLMEQWADEFTSRSQ